MLKKLIDKTPDKILKTMATILICMLVGPEVIAGMEIMALVNVIGADAFLFLVFSSFYALSIKPLIDRFMEFEKDSMFHPAAWQQITANPEYILCLVPWRSCVLVAFLAIALTSTYLLMINLFS